MIILGIDPGIAKVGYGVIEKKGKQEPCLVGYGCLKTKSSEDLSKRLLKIYQDLKKIIKKYKPDLLAIENIYFAKNTKTAINVAKAIGIILLAAEEAKLPLVEISPLQIKQSLTTFGRADKKQVQEMVKIFLKMKKIPEPDDAADALAIALTATQYKGLGPTPSFRSKRGGAQNCE